jgi:hypothetical protein
MMISALLAVSACTVTPFALKAVALDGGANGNAAAAVLAAVGAGGVPAVPAIEKVPGGASDEGPAVGAPESPPVKSARNVCATRAASAFFR